MKTFPSICKSILFFLIVFLCGVAADNRAWAEGPSFDCAKANTRIEKAICADKELAELDNTMSKSYIGIYKFQLAEGDKPAFQAEQKKWVKERNVACGKMPDDELPKNLKKFYQARIEALETKGQEIKAERKRRGDERLALFKKLDPGPDATDAQRYRAAVELLKQNGTEIFSKLTCFDCEEALQVFLSGKDVTIIEPTERFKYYDEKIIAPYQAKCPETRFFVGRGAESKDIEWLTKENPSDEEWAIYGFFRKGVENFRIYHFLPPNGESDFYAFYAGKYFHKDYGKEHISNGGFDFYNFKKKCDRYSYLGIIGQSDVDEKGETISIFGFYQHGNNIYHYQLTGIIFLGIDITKLSPEQFRSVLMIRFK